MLKGGRFFHCPHQDTKACLLNMTLKETCPSEPKEVYHQQGSYNLIANLILLNKLLVEKLEAKELSFVSEKRKKKV